MNELRAIQRCDNKGRLLNRKKIYIYIISIIPLQNDHRRACLRGLVVGGKNRATGTVSIVLFFFYVFNRIWTSLCDRCFHSN